MGAIRRSPKEACPERLVSSCSRHAWHRVSKHPTPAPHAILAVHKTRMNGCVAIDSAHSVASPDGDRRGWDRPGTKLSRIVSQKGRYFFGPDYPQFAAAPGWSAWGWVPRGWPGGGLRMLAGLYGQIVGVWTHPMCVYLEVATTSHRVVTKRYSRYQASLLLVWAVIL